MCRNIKTLFNFDPPVTPEEVHAASLQFGAQDQRFQQAFEIQRSGISRRHRGRGRDFGPAAAFAGNECAPEKSGGRSGEGPRRGKT